MMERTFRAAIMLAVAAISTAIAAMALLVTVKTMLEIQRLFY